MGRLPEGLSGYTGSCAALGNEFVIGCVKGGSPSIDFARTTNGGKSWFEDSSSLYCVRPIGGHLLASIGSKGLVDLDDDSILLADSLVSTIEGFSADEQYLYVATASRGVWQEKLSDIRLDVRPTRLAARPMLAYPNPTTAQFAISFHLSAQSSVSITLYDDLGILRARMFDGMLDAGPHTIPSLGLSLANGIYEVVLSTPTMLETTQVVICR